MPLSYIDVLLQFLLFIPIVMSYRVLPVTGTPYWLFGALFATLLLQVILLVYPHLLKNQKIVDRARAILFFVAVIIAVLGPQITAIHDRSTVAPVYGVHDIILQGESAMRYLVVGKNPYKETYFGTPMEEWHYSELGKDVVNPALYHFVMPPWYLLFPFIFYYGGIHTVGYFDGRMALVFSVIGLLGLCWYWFKDKAVSRIISMLILVTPGTIDYLIEGRSDIFALFWLVAALVLLDKKRYLLSSILFALAMLSKQTVWFALPFFAANIWVHTKKHTMTRLTSILLFGGTCAVLTVPFLVWDARAFFDSVVFYLSGNTANGYPISGYGLGMLLYSLGVVSDIHDYYPFSIWQLGIGIPVLVFFVWQYLKKPSMGISLIGYAVSLMAIWYVSRYFNNSHLSYIGALLALGFGKLSEEKSI